MTRATRLHSGRRGKKFPNLLQLASCLRQFLGVLFLDEVRRNGGGQCSYKSDTGQHQRCGDLSSRPCYGHLVAIPHGRHRDDVPPESIPIVVDGRCSNRVPFKEKFQARPSENDGRHSKQDKLQPMVQEKRPCSLETTAQDEDDPRQTHYS